MRAELRWPTLSTADLRGATTIEVRARGKHILHRLDSGWTLHSHLRMEGSWRVEPSRSPADKHRHPDVRAVVGSPTWTAVGWRLGMLDLVRTDDEATLVGHLGPDLLGPDWDPVEAARRLARHGEPIGAALLDQRNLAGVGTIWSSEILFLQRLNPWTPADELGLQALERLTRRLQPLVAASSRHGVPSTTGSRRPGANTYVHGRNHKPCRRCGTLIRLAMIGPPTRERVMYHCPACQQVPRIRI